MKSLPSLSLADRNLIISLYAASLAQGHTIHGSSIILATIKAYVKAAADFSILEGFADPRLNMQGKTAPFLAAIYTEARAFETMPNRREPVSGNMLKYMISTRGSDPDSIAYALTDFQILAHYAGLRLSEYAHPSANTITLTKNKLAPKAFLMSDFTFFGPGTKHLTQTHTQHLPHDAVSSAKARFREQKNGNHGEKVIFQANTDVPDMCPVNAMLRIRARAQRLHRSPTSPIGVASHAGTVVLLHDAMIRKHIQTAARTVYHITSNNKLARYSSHSSRVGACVRLHLAGKYPLFIQTRL